MNITIERTIEATLEVRNLIRELNDVLGAAYEEHQRHGLLIEQLFEPNVRFFVARLDGIAFGCGGVHSRVGALGHVQTSVGSARSGGALCCSSVGHLSAALEAELQVLLPQA